MRISAATYRSAPVAIPGGLWALRGRVPTPPGGGEDPDLEIAIRSATGRRLLCRACGAPITTDEERIEVAGRHFHRRTNPAGFEFDFGCFAAAAGAAAAGSPTAEFSWFDGYRWSYALCRRCGAHLGWLFEGREPRFYGLILGRLQEEEPTDLS